MNIYDFTIPQLIKIIGQAQRWLDKAEAFAAQKKFDVNTLLTARLAPDQFPLVRQVQSISDQAKATAARLAGVQAPSFEDNEKTVAELRARLEKTAEWLKTLKREQFDDAEDRIITVPWAPGKGFKGRDYIIEAGLPNFYFHASMAYAILRHNGVDLGKVDFLGAVTLIDV